MCAEAGKQGLMQWLLRRIKTKTPFDANKLYASELLSILLQHTLENRHLLGDLDGIDVLLQQLAVCIHIFINFYMYNYIPSLIQNWIICSIIRDMIHRLQRNKR